MIKQLKYLAIAFLLITASLLATPAMAKDITVGVVIPATDPFSIEAHAAFIKRLEATGVLKRIKLIEQRPQPDALALKNTVRKLITHNARIIVTYGTQATLAAISEKPGVPIVYGGVYRPIHEKFQSQNGLYGVCMDPPLSSLTRYISMSTRQKNIAILYCSNEKGSLFQMEQMMRFAAKAGLSGKPIDLRDASEVSSSLSGADVGFFFITSTACSHASSGPISRIARNRKIPIATLAGIDNIKPVMAYYTDPTEIGVSMADELDRAIRSGRKESHGVCSARDELVYDIGEARRLGLTLPMELVTGATKVIY